MRDQHGMEWKKAAKHMRALPQIFTAYILYGFIVFKVVSEAGEDLIPGMRGIVCFETQDMPAAFNKPADPGDRQALLNPVQAGQLIGLTANEKAFFSELPVIHVFLIFQKCLVNALCSLGGKALSKRHSAKNLVDHAFLMQAA